MAINRATFQITDGHLEQLVLEQADLPGEFSGHQMVREGLLDNRTMAEQGLVEVENPSELFLAEHRDGAPGSCIIPLLEGSRPLLIEIQALVAAATYGTPRRTTIGIDDSRVALIPTSQSACARQRAD